MNSKEYKHYNSSYLEEHDWDTIWYLEFRRNRQTREKSKGIKRVYKKKSFYWISMLNMLFYALLCQRLITLGTSDLNIWCSVVGNIKRKLEDFANNSTVNSFYFIHTWGWNVLLLKRLIHFLKRHITFHASEIKLRQRFALDRYSGEGSILPQTRLVHRPRRSLDMLIVLWPGQFGIGHSPPEDQTTYVRLKGPLYYL